MGKITLNKLKSGDLPEKLIKNAEAIKGGNADQCHNGGGTLQKVVDVRGMGN